VADIEENLQEALVGRFEKSTPNRNCKQFVEALSVWLVAQIGSFLPWKSVSLVRERRVKGRKHFPRPHAPGARDAQKIRICGT